MPAGVRFWKVGSRKLFAVSDRGKGKRAKEDIKIVQTIDNKEESYHANSREVF